METIVTFLLGVFFLCLAFLAQIFKNETSPKTEPNSPFLYVYPTKEDAQRWHDKAKENGLNPSNFAKTQSGWSFVVFGRHELNQVIRKKL